MLVHSIPSVSRQTWHPVITFCPSGNTLQQGKFGSYFNRVWARCDGGDKYVGAGRAD